MITERGEEVKSHNGKDYIRQNPLLIVVLLNNTRTNVSSGKNN